MTEYTRYKIQNMSVNVADYQRLFRVTASEFLDYLTGR